MSFTKEQCSNFLGRLSSLTLQITLIAMREERDLGQAAQPNLLGDGGTTGQGLSLWSALSPKLQIPNGECAERVSSLKKKKITWAQACKLDELVLSERFIGFIFFQISLLEFSYAQLNVPLKY